MSRNTSTIFNLLWFESYFLKMYTYSPCDQTFISNHNSCLSSDKISHNYWNLRGELREGADKSLARPRRKQATATKRGIYSTYSPRSSIHFLARCSNFCKPLKKESEVWPSNQVSSAAITSASEEKWRTFNCFFSLWNRW